MPYKFILRAILILVVIITIIIVSIQLSFTLYFDNFIKNELQKEVALQSKGDYDMKIENLQTSIFDQSIYVSDFIFIPSKSNSSTVTKYFAAAKEMNLLDFKLMPFLLNKELIVSKLELINPTGIIYRGTDNVKSIEHDSTKNFTIYNLISKRVKRLNIFDIEIKNADIKVFDNYRDTVASIESKDNELRIVNLQINKATDDAHRLFFAENVNLILNRFAYTTKDSLYTFQAKRLMASYTDSTMLIDSLQLIPNYSKKVFANEAGEQTDRMKIAIADIAFKKINVKLFFERNWLVADKMAIEGLDVAAYRDKNDIRLENKVKSMQELLKSIPFYAAIDSIKLKNGLIAYQEVALGAKKPGKIVFNNLNATITGFTSDSALFSSYNQLQVNASCNFMNKGKLKAYCIFPLNTNQMVFDCSGSLRSMPMEAINPMLEPNANISIKGGEIDSMVFSFHANNLQSTGTMKFVYHHLKIELLNKKSKRSGAVNQVLSFLAHQLIIKENNPLKNKPIRVTAINYKRNPNRFIFNYSWKSILSGIKPAIGLPEKLGN